MQTERRRPADRPWRPLRGSARGTGALALLVLGLALVLGLGGSAAAARAAGLADNSPQMLDAVRATLAARYGQWRRFDEFLALNVEGMIRWRAGG